MARPFNGGGRAAAGGGVRLLFPLFFIPSFFFCPSSSASSSPPLFLEWNVPRSRHLNLLSSALQRESSESRQDDLWSPLDDQGWRPFVQSSGQNSEFLLLVYQNLSSFGERMAHSPDIKSCGCEDWNCRILHLLQRFERPFLQPILRPLGFRGFEQIVTCYTSTALPENTHGYLQVFLDGGLNQQRMGICDAVALAKILNSTLVIPYLEVNPVWQDSSSFSDIFDVDHFINVLKDDIHIVRELPDEFSWSTREYYTTAIRPNRIKTAPAHASINWYLESVLPVLQSYGIAAIAPFSHRLTFDNVPADIQLLRCKVNFLALEFVPHIRELGDALIGRLTSQSDGTDLREMTDSNVKSNGKFVALHLRFDKDMAAHSACDFGGGKAEKLALAKYRQVMWQGRVLNSQFTDEELRSQGRCPLTPEEVGLLLAALGFDNNTRLYLASHKVYGGAARIAALRSLFPLMEDKKSLASAEERGRINGKASLLAAVDYYVSMHSDVFISASPGNMHNALVGHRTYKNLKTIRPNMPLLGQLFLNKSMSWSEFQDSVIKWHDNRQGQIRLRKPKQSLYTYPAPDCMCAA